MPGFLLSGVVMKALLAATATVVGLVGRGADDLTLVGSAGEIYKRDTTAETPTWRRDAGGGVAATLVTARGAALTDVWALGSSTPPYRYDGTTWSASTFPMTGTAVMSTSGAPAVAVARRVMVWSQGKWVQLPTTGAKGILAVWAGGPKDALVATVDGDLRRYDGTTWTIITPKLVSTTERIRALQAGVAPAVIAMGDQGSLLTVDKTSAKAVTLETRITMWNGQIGAQTTTGQPYLLGAATVEGRERLAIGKIESGKLVLVDTLPALAAGDAAVAMLAAKDGSLVVVTRQGVVHMRAADGGWTRGVTDPSLPAVTKSANPPAVSATTPTQPASK